MICPICGNNTSENVCLECEYLLSHDLMNNRLLIQLNSKEIEEYKKSITIQKRLYKRLKEYQNNNNLTTNDKKKTGELYNLGYDYYRKGEYLKAVEYFEQAAILGDGGAQFYLGLIYLYGKSGGFKYIEKYYSKAKKYFENAIKNNRSTAYKCLGDMYFEGKGVPIDEKKGLELYDKAIRQDNDYALKSLIGYYERGYGCIKKNQEKAKEIARKYRKR